jgi:hypothetical protein
MPVFPGHRKKQMNQVLTSAQFGQKRTNQLITSRDALGVSLPEVDLLGRASAILAVGNSEYAVSRLQSPLLCRKDAARYLGIATQTLASWACSRKINLPFVKIGCKVLYRKSDLDDFIAANMHNVTTMVLTETRRG